MRATRVIDACGREVVVKELTVGEVRAWLAGLASEAQAGDVVDLALFDTATLADVLRMTDLTVADLEAATPSEIAAVLEACSGVNAHFFGLRAKLAETAATSRPAAT